MSMYYVGGQFWGDSNYLEHDGRYKTPERKKGRLQEDPEFYTGFYPKSKYKKRPLVNPVYNDEDVTDLPKAAEARDIAAENYYYQKKNVKSATNNIRRLRSQRDQAKANGNDAEVKRLDEKIETEKIYNRARKTALPRLKQEDEKAEERYQKIYSESPIGKAVSTAAKVGATAYRLGIGKPIAAPAGVAPVIGRGKKKK